MNFIKTLNDIFKRKEILITKVKTSDSTAGNQCPHCGNCSIDYDGLLDLRCKVSGFLSTGNHT